MMKCYEAKYVNDNEQETTMLIGRISFKNAASKAADQESAKQGELIELKLTDKVIL